MKINELVNGEEYLIKTYKKEKGYCATYWPVVFNKRLNIFINSDTDKFKLSEIKRIKKLHDGSFENLEVWKWKQLKLKIYKYLEE